MRNLTILRRKKAAAALTKMKVYIEDPFSNELEIKDVPCRKLGELKNGEEVTFQIENRAAKIFIIADKMSKDYCNDYYQLPDGEEDIYLSGENKVDLAGNAFVFDGNDTPEMKEERKKGKLKGRMILIAALVGGIILGSFAGKALFSGTEKEKVFTSNGMSITLTNKFKEMDAKEMGYTAAFASNNAAVLALKEPFESLGEYSNISLSDYLDLVLSANSERGAVRTTVGGMDCITFNYTDPNTSNHFKYIAYPYKSSDAFWLIQFATLEKDAEKYSQQITTWAKSVTFK